MYRKYESKFIKQNDKLLHQILIEMNYAEKTLDSKIKKEKNGIAQTELIDLIKSVASGLKFAHKNKCIHFDIKPANILFENSKWKISDWGASVMIKGESKKPISESICYTKCYASPELIKTILYEKKKIKEENLSSFYKSDVYSLGITALRCCGIKKEKIMSIPTNNPEDHNSKIYELVKEKESMYSSKFRKILRGMTKFDPEERLSTKEIIQKLDEIKDKNK